MHNKIMIQAIGLTLSGLLVAGGAYAADQKSPQAAEKSVTVQGVQVAIDPATGRLVAPTAAQRAALSKAMLGQASTAPLQLRDAATSRPLTQADALRTLKRSSTGKYAASMQVPETLMSGLVAERQADGSIAIHHQGDVAPVANHAAKEAVR